MVALAAALAVSVSVSVSVPLGPGHDAASVSLRRPAGVVLLSRLTVPHGAHVRALGLLGRIAGVGVDTRGSTVACTRRGAVDVCTQGQEWCPLPAGRWRWRITKLSGPAGPVRLEFVVGAPPAPSG